MTARFSLPATNNQSLTTYPAIGIVGTAIGTLAAIEFLPQNIEPAGALWIPASLLCLGLGIAPALAVIQQPKAFFRAENLLAVCPIYWLLLDLVQGTYPLVGVDRVVVTKTFVAVGIFAGSVWLGALGRPWKPPGFVRRSAELYLEPKLIFRIGIAFFALGFCRFAIPASFNIPEMLSALQRSRFAAPWSRTAISSGLVVAVIDHFIYFGFLLPTLTVLLALRKGWTHRMTLALIALTLILTVFIAHGGNRRIIGVMYGSAIVLWVLEQARLNLQRIVILAVTGVAILSFLQFMLNYRSKGIALFDEQPNERVGAVINENYVVEGELQRNSNVLIKVDDNFLRLSQIVQVFDLVAENNGGRYYFLAERPLIYALSRPIPRALWPGKPISPGFNLGQLVGLGASLSSSIIADWYMCAGLLGVGLGGLFYGRLATMASYILRRAQPGSTAPITYSFMALAMVAGYRQLIDLVLMSYLFFIWVGVSYFFLKRAPADDPLSSQNQPVREQKPPFSPHA